MPISERNSGRPAPDFGALSDDPWRPKKLTPKSLPRSSRSESLYSFRSVSYRLAPRICLPNFVLVCAQLGVDAAWFQPHPSGFRPSRVSTKFGVALPRLGLSGQIPGVLRQSWSVFRQTLGDFDQIRAPSTNYSTLSTQVGVACWTKIGWLWRGDDLETINSSLRISVPRCLCSAQGWARR